MEWIKIEDKQPEPGFPVLFYSQSCGVLRGIKSYGNRKIKWFQSSNKNYKDVTHWMPLPEPPKF
jgi:hypothetical protein